MIAIGIRRALPLGRICTRPMARGPLLTFALPMNCADGTCARLKTSANNVTAEARVRYNDVRRGETAMDINDKAPEFTLLDQDEKKVSLKDFRGRTVVLYFYPKA